MSSPYVFSLCPLPMSSRYVLSLCPLPISSRYVLSLCPEMETALLIFPNTTTPYAFSYFQGPRAQICRKTYRKLIRDHVTSLSGLHIVECSVDDLIIETTDDGRKCVKGIKLGLLEFRFRWVNEFISYSKLILIHLGSILMYYDLYFDLLKPWHLW